MEKKKGMKKHPSQWLRDKKTKPNWISLLKEASKDSSALSQAYRLTRQVSKVGFDWPDLGGVLRKLDEEIEELREALSLQDKKRICEEMGDLLFVLVNVSRWLQIDPEEALKKTLKKFSSRFHYIETALHQQGKTLQQSNLDEMDQLWEKSKGRVRRP